jgi:hypothetical protein
MGSKFPNVGGILPVLERNGGFPVNIQDQTSKALDLDFIRSLGQNTLAVDTVVNATTITVTDSTGFAANNIIGIFDNAGNFYFGTQLGAPAGNVITVDTPLDRVFPSGSNVIRATKDMKSVAGTLASPVIYQIGPIGQDIEVDIVRVCGYIQAASAMDLAKFGDLTALTNGIVLRKSNGTNANLWNAKTNGRLKLLTGVDLDITDRAPGGSEGLNFRLTYAGQSKHGVALRLLASETLELLVQDNLTTLQAFEMVAQGHIVTD